MKALALAGSLLILAAGCARDDGEAELPFACQNVSARGLALALSAAPAAVGFEDVRLSDCFPAGASVGDVQLMGALAVDAAQMLRRDGDAAALGYLVGVVRSASVSGQGTYGELLRRLEQEASPLTDLPAFARGARAGRTSG